MPNAKINVKDNLDTEILDGDVTHTVKTGTRDTLVNGVEKGTFHERREFIINNGQLTNISLGEKHSVLTSDQNIEIKSGNQDINVEGSNRFLKVKSSVTEKFETLEYNIKGFTNRLHKSHVDDFFGKTQNINVDGVTFNSLSKVTRTVNAALSNHTNTGSYQEFTNSKWNTDVQSGEATLNLNSSLNLTSLGGLTINTQKATFTSNYNSITALVYVENGTWKQDFYKFVANARLLDGKAAAITLTGYGKKTDIVGDKFDIKIFEIKSDVGKVIKETIEAKVNVAEVETGMQNSQ